MKIEMNLVVDVEADSTDMALIRASIVGALNQWEKVPFAVAWDGDKETEVFVVGCEEK